jgi:hypothetical protein
MLIRLVDVLLKITIQKQLLHVSPAMIVTGENQSGTYLFIESTQGWQLKQIKLY